MRTQICFAVFTASVAMVGEAKAQVELDAETVVLDQIMVSAQRREQVAKDVPISLRVLSREELQERIVRRLDQAFEATPNATVTSQRGGNDASTMTIRGVATTAFGADPSIAVYVDDVYVGNDNGFNARMADLEQIEILRGPQGTLYGRNAIGGAVNVRTGSPELGVNSVYAESGVGTDGLLFGQGTVNFALADTVAARISVFGDRSDGWVNNEAGGPDFMNLDDYGGRAKLLAAVTPDWDVELTADYSRDKGRRSGYGPFETIWEDGVNLGEPFQDHMDSFGASLKSTTRTGFGEVISVTAYRGADAKGEGGSYDPAPMQNAAYSRDYDQVTEEVRVSGETDRLDWTVGAFGLYSQDNRYEASGFYPALPANTFFPGQPALPAMYEEGTRTDVDTTSLALFGDVTWRMTEQLNLVAGARGSYDRKKIDYVHGSTMGAFAFLAPPITTSQSTDGFDISPRVGLIYELTEDTNVYATISRAYKPAGFNIAFAPTADIGYDAESAINYEVGLKGEALDGQVGYAVSAFYFDWRDQQVYSFVNNQLVINNAPKSRSFGGEAEVNVELVDGLMLYAGVGILDAKFVDYPNAMSGMDESGNWQPFASRYSANLSAEYRRAITDDLVGFGRVDYNYRSSFYWDSANTIEEPGYGIVNARLGVEGDHWSLSAFAQNMFDQEYRIAAQTYTQGVLAIPGTPQTFGVVGSVSF
ncbi:TonB-dependent receptor [Amorphus sp. 3PC139-8]|uniref:TonB-dependent receptor n=1 Tax=Amorphus sp. 3PC139-8 TaxID=2735676 RepID=UPI00345D8807